MASKSTRGKGDGGLYKNSDGYWTAVVELPRKLDDKRRRKVIRRKNKAEALRELNALKSELKEHGDISTTNMTVSEWLKYWFETIQPGTASPSANASRRNAIEHHLSPLLGKKKLDKLTARDVRKFHLEMSERPKKTKIRAMTELERPAEFETLGHGSIIACHAALSNALDAAVHEGMVTKNVAQVAGPPKGRSSSAQEALSVENTGRLLAYLATHPHGAMWATYILTGARRGEVLGLESDRLKNGVLDLSWQLQNFQQRDLDAADKDYEVRHVSGALYLARPKSSAGWRILPLVDPLKSILERHMLGRADGLVFLNDWGRPHQPVSISAQWHDLLDGAGIDRGVKLHGVRHTVVDLLYDAGVPEQVIQQIVGHSDVRMTRKYKTRVNQGEAQKALEGLGAFIKNANKSD